MIASALVPSSSRHGTVSSGTQDLGFAFVSLDSV